MGLRKNRFIHYQTLDKETPYKGFTVELVPIGDDNGTPDNQNTVDLYVAMCHKVDHFSRAGGRYAVGMKKVQNIKVVELPIFLSQLEAKCWHYKIVNKRAAANRWAWVWKYFL